MRGSDSEVGGEDGGGVVGVSAMAEAPSAATGTASVDGHTSRRRRPLQPSSAIGTDLGARELFKQSISQERPLLIIFDILPLNNNNT